LYRHLITGSKNVKGKDSFLNSGEIEHIGREYRFYKGIEKRMTDVIRARAKKNIEDEWLNEFLIELENDRPKILSEILDDMPSPRHSALFVESLKPAITSIIEDYNIMIFQWLMKKGYLKAAIAWGKLVSKESFLSELKAS
jgi:hypothetical protein